MTLEVEWDSSTIVATATRADGVTSYTATASNSASYGTGQLRMGTGWMNGDTYFTELHTAGTVPSPSPSPTMAHTDVVFSSDGWVDYCGGQTWTYGTTFDGETVAATDSNNVANFVANTDYHFDASEPGSVKYSGYADSDDDLLYIGLFDLESSGVIISVDMQNSALNIQNGSLAYEGTGTCVTSDWSTVATSSATWSKVSI